MTNDELEQIRARAEAATAGPWEADITGEIYAPDQSSVCMALMSDVGLNAAFIAHARTDIPALLDEVERLREERAQASDAANDWHGKAAYEEARATRAEAAEAEGERRRKEMAVEITGLRRSYTDEKVKATRAEARAERLAGALEMTQRTEGLCVEFRSGLVHETRQEAIIKELRKIAAARDEALSAYNQRT